MAKMPMGSSPQEVQGALRQLLETLGTGRKVNERAVMDSFRGLFGIVTGDQVKGADLARKVLQGSGLSVAEWSRMTQQLSKTPQGRRALMATLDNVMVGAAGIRSAREAASVYPGYKAFRAAAFPRLREKVAGAGRAAAGKVREFAAGGEKVYGPKDALSLLKGKEGGPGFLRKVGPTVGAAALGLAATPVAIAGVDRLLQEIGLRESPEEKARKLVAEAGGVPSVDDIIELLEVQSDLGRRYATGGEPDLAALLAGGGGPPVAGSYPVPSGATVFGGASGGQTDIEALLAQRGR